MNKAHLVEIAAGLYIGSAEATNCDTLAANQIECVLNVAHRNNDMNNGKHQLHDYLLIEMEDSWEAAHHLMNNVIPQALEFINRHFGKRRILVHCSAGKSRSGAVVVAWLMRTWVLPYEEALKFARLKRPEINPNHGFAVALKAML